MLWERYGSDFVYQNGKWYYFHEHVCPDFGYSYNSEDWVHSQYVSMTAPKAGPGGPGGEPPAPKGRGKKDPPCTDPGPLHQSWSLLQTVQDSVSWPVPYVTLDDQNSYAPGHNDPNKNLQQNLQKFMG